MRLRFGDLTFDGGRRLLFRGPDAVHLTPKAFQFLELLLSRRPDAVAKAEIQESLWRETFVTEGNLATLVAEVRKALGESGRGESCIRTVFGFGYAFDGSVREVANARPRPRSHSLFWGRQEMDLADGENLIGRERTAAVWIGHPSVSREHALVVVTGDLAEIEDRGSKNGTWVGDRRASARLLLSDGDEVRVGSVVLTYRKIAAGLSSDTKTSG